MTRLAQVGIAIGALGLMISIMGLFPGVTGLDPTPGVGIFQLLGILTGFTLLIFGAWFYVKFAFYASRKSTLLQQIGTRFAMTGLVLAPLAGLSDSLGFGSHSVATTGDVFLGPLQALGIVSSFVMSCLGVLIYALGGNPVEYKPIVTETMELPHVVIDLPDTEEPITQPEEDTETA